MPNLMSGWGIFSLECMDWDGRPGHGPIDFTPDAIARQTYPTSPVRSGSKWSSGFAIVAVMQSAEDGLTGHGPHVLGLDSPRLRGILLKSEMSPRPVVVGQVLLQHSPMVGLTKHYHMVEALPPNCPDNSLAVTILPGGAGSSDDLLDIQGGKRIYDSASSADRTWPELDEAGMCSMNHDQHFGVIPLKLSRETY